MLTKQPNINDYLKKVKAINLKIKINSIVFQYFPNEIFVISKKILKLIENSVFSPKYTKRPNKKIFHVIFIRSYHFT